MRTTIATLSKLFLVTLVVVLAAPALAASPAAGEPDASAPALAAATDAPSGPQGDLLVPAASMTPAGSMSPAASSTLAVSGEGLVCKDCASRWQCRAACGGICLRDVGLHCGDDPDRVFCFCAN